MIYRRRATALHAARAGVAALFCLALALVPLIFDHPLVLAAAALACVGAGALAEVGAALRRAAWVGLWLGLLIAVVNPFVSRNGLTVFARLGEVPPFGQIDLTVEALAYGGIFGLKLLVLGLAGVLFSTCVDPDELLRIARRASLRSALTAALGTRVAPVLARDARRIAEARRCRPDAAGGGARGSGSARGGIAERGAIVRAVAGSALERAVDVAATLEVRGYGLAGRARRERAPWSRHDLAFAAAAVAIVVLAVGARIGGIGGFDAYPLLSMSLGPAEIGLSILLVLVAVLPGLDRRGVER